MIKLVLVFLAFVVGIPLIGFVGYMAVAYVLREYYKMKKSRL
jgi:predicted ATP-grasp superfamily ATP-dependent carboligase